MATPTTEVRLLSNVPLSNSYEHQMTFISRAQQSTYFTGKTAFYGSQFTYQREHGAIMYPIHYDGLSNVNYVMYRNGAYPDKWFYAFITKKEYINPNNTRIHFELDVFQTWQFDYELKPSFIEREHQRRFDSNNKPIVNTVDEGLNYGTEYETVSVTQYLPYDPVYFLVIVATQRMDVNGEGIEPMLNGSPQPLSYYIHPFKLDGTSPKVSIGSTTDINISPIKDVLTNLYKQEGAVNNIVSLYITEYPGMDISYAGDNLLFLANTVDHATIQDDTGTMNTLYLKQLLKYGARTKDLGNKFSGFKGVTESKLMMHPYAVTILSDMKGNQQEIKHEYIQGDNLEIMVKGSLGVSNKVSYNVKNYLMSDSITNGTEISFSNGIINNSPNDVPIINEMLAAFLQGNRNQLENQKDSIIFGSLANTVGNLFGGIGSAIGGNPVGAVSAGAGMITGAVDAHFQIEGMQAKTQDLNNTPAQISKMGGNTAFDYGNGVTGLYVIRKQITVENRTRLENYFKMFGYKVNDLKTPNLKSRTHFNFIKTVGANVVGNIPHDDLIKIKTIFDKGFTMWHGDFVGDYSLSNVES